MFNVEVVLVEDSGYYSSEYISGSTVKVTLRRDDEYVSCDDILIWDSDEYLSDIFNEWKELAEAGEEGYDYWVTVSN